MNNLAQRTVSGFILAAIMVCACLLGPLFPVLGAFAIGWTMHEYYSMAYGHSGDFIPERILAVFSALTVFGLLNFILRGMLDARFLVLALLPVLAMMIVPVWMKDHSRHTRIAHVYTGLVCIGLPLSILPLLTLSTGKHDGWLLLCIIAVIWLSDVGAYALGTALGQRPGAKKLAPAISPKKSWWGLAGAVIAGAAVSVGLYYLGIFKLPLVHCIAVGMLSSAFGVLGDLVESMFKRDFGFKDSGNLIPGHGGLYDRLDSLIVAVAAITAYLVLFGLL